MDLFNLFAKISLDTSEYENGLENSEKHASSFGKKLKTGLGTAAKVGTAALAAVSTGMVAFAKSSIETGKEFDKSMSQVAATMGYTVEQLNAGEDALAAMSEEERNAAIAAQENFGKLRGFAQDMGASTAFSASQAADALNYMALAGYDTTKSMEMLPTVLNLAASGNMDLAIASDMVTDAQSALGLTLDETRTMVDQMAKASSKSNTSIDQLGQAFLTVGATARNIKGGTQELSTVLGVLADNGIKGAEGGTHLRNAILSLQTPTKNGAAALKKLGMSYKDIYDEAGNMRALPEIFQQMSGAMEGMSQQAKDAIISGIFNKTDLAAVNALLGTNEERWNELRSAIENADGAAEQMAGTQLDNLAGDVTLFKSALEGAQIIISDQLSPSLREFVQFGTEGIQKISDAFKEGDLEGAMGAFGEVLSEGINMIVGKAPEFIKAAVKLVNALIDGLMSNIDLILNAMVDIGLQLVDAFIENYPKFIEAGLKLLLAIGQGLAEALPTLIPKIVKMVLEIAKMFVQNIPLMIDVAIQLMTGLANGLIEALPIIVEMLPEIIENLIDAVLDNIDLIIDLAVNLTLALAEALVTNADKLLEAAPRIIAKLVIGLLEAVPKLLDAAGTLIKALIDGIITGAPVLWEKLKKLGGELVDRIKEGWQNSSVKQWVEEKITAIKDGFNSAKEAIKTTVSNVFGGAKEKIQEKLEEARNKVEEIVNKIKGFFDFTAKTPKIKLPHFKIEPEGWKFDDLLKGTIPKLTIKWYKKAYENPYLFTSPTVVGNRGFGDGQGGEIVYGHENLMDDIRAASASDDRLNIIIELLQDIVANGLQANIEKNQLYKSMADMNRKRNYATGYNAFSGV